jgi:hypothetical protein
VPDQPDPDVVEFPEDGLVVVPTLAGFQHLTERVEALEGRIPATVPGDDDGRRLDRHRAELEAIKRWLNQLLAALRPYLSDAPDPLTAAPQPAPTPKDYQ